MRLNIRTKLFGGFGIAVVLLLVVSVVAFVSLNSVANKTSEVKQAADLDDAVMSMIIAVQDGLDVEMRALMASDTQGLREQFQKTVAAFDDAVARFNQLATDEMRAAVAELTTLRDDFEGSILTTFDLIENSGSNGTVINVSGRQRMLTQKMTKETLAIASGDANARSALADTAKEFDTNLKDLIAGNPDRDIPAPAGDVPAQLQKIQALWQPFYEQVQVVLTAPTDSPEFKAAVDYISNNNLQLLTESNAAVTLYAQQLEVASDNHRNSTRPAVDAILTKLDEVEPQVMAMGENALASANATRSSSTTMVIVVSLIAVISAAAIAFWISQGVAKGVKKMALAADGISTGDLEQNVEVNSKDEIGDMAHSFQQMIAYLKEMAGAAEQIADGDLTVEVQPKSEKDTLGNSFQRMVGYLKEMAGAAEQIADGDFTVEVQPKSRRDVLGNAFAKMVVNLRGLLSRTRETAERLAAAKDQIAQSAEQAAQATQEVAKTITQVAEGTSQQAANVQEVNQGMEQLSQAIEQIVQGAQTQSQAVEEANALGHKVARGAEQMAEAAQTAAAGARQAAETAQNGAAMVQNTIESMARIKRTVDVAAEEISRLGERSAEIGKIVAVINDIAAQTNLLALNAAIEAARAGEQGRGFAVVADEVRQLAERVAAATKEIADLISGVQQGVDSSVKAMSEGATETETGAKVATEAGAALQAILGAVNDMNAQIEQIAAGSQELKASGSEMVSVIAEIQKVVEQNSASTEEMQATASTVSESISAIAAAAEQNSAAAQQVSAAAQEMAAQVEEVTAATQTLTNAAQELKQRISAFKLVRDVTSRQRQQTAAAAPAGAPPTTNGDQGLPSREPDGHKVMGAVPTP